MLNIKNIPQILYKNLSSPTKVPPKTVIISHKNGKDYVADEYVGTYYRHTSIMDLLSNFLQFNRK